MKLLFFLLLPTLLVAQFTTKEIPLLPGEQWFGGRTADAHLMPLDSGYTVDLRRSEGGSVQPLLLSDQGRYVFAAKPFQIAVTDSTLEVTGRTEDKIAFARFGKSLAEVHAFVAKNYLNFKRRLPNAQWFERPGYQLSGKVGQRELLEFAEAIVDKGLPPGIITLGDGWQRDYGIWRFNRAGKAYPEPEKMVTRLRELGFTLQLTINPFVSIEVTQMHAFEGQRSIPVLIDPNRPPQPKGYELNEKTAELVYQRGSSNITPDVYLLDPSHPEAVAWIEASLQRLTDSIGVGGFCFIGGDFENFDFVISHKKNLSAQALSLRYVNLADGERLDLIDVDYGHRSQHMARSMPLIVSDWEDLPKMLSSAKIMGLMGYYYFSPPSLEAVAFDAELLIRFVQAQQFFPLKSLDESVLLLNDEQMEIVKRALAESRGRGGYMAHCIEATMNASLPAITDLSYHYPEADEAKDQYLLGEDLLVAPVLVAGQRSRLVTFPAGRWKLNATGEVFAGGQTVKIPAPLEYLLYFWRLDEE